MSATEPIAARARLMSEAGYFDENSDEVVPSPCISVCRMTEDRSRCGVLAPSMKSAPGRPPTVRSGAPSGCSYCSVPGPMCPNPWPADSFVCCTQPLAAQEPSP